MVRSNHARAIHDGFGADHHQDEPAIAVGNDQASTGLDLFGIRELGKTGGSGAANDVACRAECGSGDSEAL